MDQSKLSANRRTSMQLFILGNLVREIKKGKTIDLNEIPQEIVEMLLTETTKNEELRAALANQS
ncbi:MAG: hypothetical protein QM710_10355 [Flavobacterium sp.]